MTLPIERTNALMYKYRIYSIAKDINVVQKMLHHRNYYDSNKESYSSSNEIPPGFARECMLEFIKYDGGWFVENGISISVDTFIDPMLYQYRAELIAHMNAEQKEMWEKREFLGKLAGA
jgi:hypothetical protein